MELRERAEEIFAWGKSCRNDGLVLAWENHSRGAAKVAEEIAKKAGMDADKAYAMGLLHDIGRYKLHAGMDHIILGYEKLMSEGLDEVARICLTHSFNPKEKVLAVELSDAEKDKFVKEFVQKIEFDDYDRLIQLADYMSGAHGVSTIERRFCSVLVRHNLAEPREVLLTLYRLKRYFDEKCGIDVYELFRKELEQTPFRGIPGKIAEEEMDEILKKEER